MYQVKWSFIEELEGNSLEGYVPDQSHSKSGVTIASGIDLSAWNVQALSGLPEALLRLLEPYLGLTGADAVAALQGSPLSISIEQADELDELVQGLTLTRLAQEYDADSSVIFDQLPSEAQTVIASVAFQYGHEWTRCPHFWAKAIAQDWLGCVTELQNFGDRYPTRHKKEADYLNQIPFDPG